MTKLALVTARKITYDGPIRTITLTLVTDSGKVVERIGDVKVGTFIEERKPDNV